MIRVGAKQEIEYNQETEKRIAIKVTQARSNTNGQYARTPQDDNG
jgi:hypothetical protein